MAREPYTGGWGRFGREPPCEHLIALARHLVASGMAIWSEHGTRPQGWVNVHCATCRRTYETSLDEHIHGVGEE